MITMRTTALVCALGLGLVPAPVRGETLPTFEAQTIDDDVKIGYGTAIGDVDGDGRPDILLADKTEFVWYRNPDWTRFVMAANLTTHDNVCLAARDIDGDGRVEVAVGAQWNPGDTHSSGAVFSLVPPEDRTGRWTPVHLPHDPVIHRMRWVDLADDGFVLVVSPLHGRGNERGEGVGVRLMAYAPPDDPTGRWATTVLEDTLHVTHNLDPAQWDPTTPAEEILYLGREGGMLLSYHDGAWTKTPFEGMKGGGEIRMGLHSPSAPYVATIEPFHGESLVYYPSAWTRGSGPDGRTALGEPVVLDDDFKQGHAIATADLFGNGSEQIVAGWRNPNRQGRVGVRLYHRTDDGWSTLVIDDDTMATEDIRIGDLDADGRPDIVAAGRASHNLKVYWNRPSRD